MMEMAGTPMSTPMKRARTSTPRTPVAKSPADVVLFDFGGTLDADGVHWSPRFHAAYRAVGGGLDFAAFDSFFKPRTKRSRACRVFGRSGSVPRSKRRLDWSSGFCPTAWTPGVLAQRLHAEALEIVARNRPILERLARRYRLGVVSNFTGNLRPCLEELGLARFFAVLSDSAVVGWSKPDPASSRTRWPRCRPYRSARGCGRQLEADIRGAAGLGLRTCWLAPSDRAPPGGEVVPTARISRFPDVERVLE